MMVLYFVVPGTPVAKGRPRFSRRGKFVKTYTDEKTMRFEECVAFYTREAMKLVDYPFPIDGPVRLEIEAVFLRPKSRKKGSEMDRKPDLTNVIKGVEDGMENGGVYVNDSRVVELSARKEYGELAETRVRVFTLCPDCEGSGRLVGGGCEVLCPACACPVT